MGWKKREISEKEVEQFSRRFQEQARFLVDESLGVEASRVISDSGWDAIYVGDVGLTGRSDEDVMNYAKQEGRIILTHDQDFLDDRRFPMDQNPGVVVLPGAMGATGREASWTSRHDSPSRSAGRPNRNEHNAAPA